MGDSPPSFSADVRFGEHGHPSREMGWVYLDSSASKQIREGAIVFQTGTRERDVVM